jgi:proton glutamate symport protein
MPWYKQLHWKIIFGLVLGLIYGLIASNLGWGQFTSDWISPFGKIFVNLLKLIALPLVLASLITGVSSLSDIKRLSRIGGKTIAIYIGTTVIALTIGLLVVNVLQPGKSVSPEIRDKIQASYKDMSDSKVKNVDAVKERGPLQPLIDMVPANIVGSASNNRNMLQIVFFSILFGIALIQVPKDKAQPIQDFFSSLNDVVIRMVDIIMLMAPIGVFSLLANTVTSVAGDDPNSVMELISALGFYSFTVVLGLFLHGAITFPVMLRLFTPMKLKTFMQGMAPVQLLAFSTSSSGATLPLTMERCEEKLGVSEEVSSFALPLGATINMDGTGLYQAVAAVFIAQTLGMDLDLGAQLTIIFTAVLASIGTAAVPGAGIIMLVVILESIGVPSDGIALILGVDRILDMCRTTINVTGDATVATVVAASEGQLGEPNLDETRDAIHS